MIIPMVCFTCGKPIAHLWFGPTGYLALVKEHTIHINMQRKKIIETSPSEQDMSANLASLPTPEFVALQQLQIMRECCRRMFLCQHDMYEKVI